MRLSFVFLLSLVSYASDQSSIIQLLDKTHSIEQQQKKGERLNIVVENESFEKIRAHITQDKKVLNSAVFSSGEKKSFSYSYDKLSSSNLYLVPLSPPGARVKIVIPKE